MPAKVACSWLLFVGGGGGIHFVWGYLFEQTCWGFGRPVTVGVGQTPRVLGKMLV